MYEAEELTRKFWWLTAPQAAIRHRLKPDRNVPIQRLRYAEVWHHMPLAKNWAATVGCWGSIRTGEEIQDIAKVNYNTFKAFRTRFNLESARTKENLEPAWKVAQTAAKDFKHNFKMPEIERVVVVAQNNGILGIELMLYVRVFEDLMKRFKVKDPLDLRPDLIEVAWNGVGGIADAIDMATTGTYSEDPR